MNFYTRLSNGWKITKASFAILKQNKQLILFPVLSSISSVLVIGSFILIAAGVDIHIHSLNANHKVMYYLSILIFYIVNYFIVVFFNMALIHCTGLYLAGEEVTINKGLKFSLSRVNVIFSWALMAATVGVILNAIQDKAGWIGKIITGLIGIVWSVVTFFVVPVIAYENIGPIAALKRSSQLMKEKWGESLVPTFSFALLKFIAFIPLIILAFYFMFSLIFLGFSSFGSLESRLFICFCLLIPFTIATLVSALEKIFISMVYHNINGNLENHFSQEMTQNLFVKKTEKHYSALNV